MRRASSALAEDVDVGREMRSRKESFRVLVGEEAREEAAPSEGSDSTSRRLGEPLTEPLVGELFLVDLGGDTGVVGGGNGQHSASTASSR